MSPQGPNTNDPFFVVEATKEEGGDVRLPLPLAPTPTLTLTLTLTPTLTPTLTLTLTLTGGDKRMGEGMDGSPGAGFEAPGDDE